MEREWTLADLNAVAEFSERLKDIGVLAIGIGYSQTTIHVMPKGLASIAGLLGRQPYKKPHPRGDFWLCSLACGDLLVYALLRPDELPLIGYPEEPVPPLEGVDLEPAAALQAS